MNEYKSLGLEPWQRMMLDDMERTRTTSRQRESQGAYAEMDWSLYGDGSDEYEEDEA